MLAEIKAHQFLFVRHPEPDHHDYPLKNYQADDKGEDRNNSYEHELDQELVGIAKKSPSAPAALIAFCANSPAPMVPIMPPTPWTPKASSESSNLSWILVFFSVIILTEGLAQSNVTFKSNLNQYSTAGYNDVWGYVDGNGIEYALLGCGTGTSIIRVDNPTQPSEVVFIPGPTSIWRDIKTHGSYAYIVTEGTGTGRGLQIVDLSQLPVSASLVNTIETWFTRAHNIFIDNGFAYVIGTDGGGGMHILDLSNPINPVRTAYYTGSGYIHDVFVWNDTVVL